MKMHILVVVNGLSRKEESSILTLRKYCQKQSGVFRSDLLYVMPTKPVRASVRLPFRGRVDAQEECTRHAKQELARCANLFGCADSQQWIAMGSISQESLMLAKKLSAQSVLLSNKEDASSVNYAQCPQMPRMYSVKQYVDMHCTKLDLHGYIFGEETAVA